MSSFSNSEMFLSRILMSEHFQMYCLTYKERKKREQWRIYQQSEYQKSMPTKSQFQFQYKSLRNHIHQNEEEISAIVYNTQSRVKLPPLNGKKDWKIWFARFEETAESKRWNKKATTRLSTAKISSCSSKIRWEREKEIERENKKWCNASFL